MACSRLRSLALAFLVLNVTPDLLPPSLGSPDGPPVSDPEGTTLITGAHVIDMVTPGIRRDHAVLVEGGRIGWVGPANEAPRPDGVRTIDGGGSYLMPGLIDAHVHLSDPLEYPLYLAAGVTSVVELGGPDHRKWRDDVAQGRAVGPRQVHCGPTVSAGDAAGARAVVEAHAKAGFDCIKIYDDMPAEVFTALATAARDLGLRSTAHIPRNLTWSDMLTAAPDAVAHAEEFLYSPCCSMEDLKLIAATMSERGIALISTLVTYDNITSQVSDIDLFLSRQPVRYYPPVQFRVWGRSLNRYATFDSAGVLKMRRLFDFQRDLVGYLHEHGVRIVAGTDAGNTGTFPGVSLADELALLVASGLSEQDALAAATREAAAWIGDDGRSGTIAVGAEADLVLLAGDPLADISNVRFVRGVMTRGLWIDGDRLRAMREQVAADLEPEAGFVQRADRDGVVAALAWLGAQDIRLRFGALEEFGYQKLKLEHAPADALRAFQANARLHPDDWSAQVSLAEGLLAAGDREAAMSAAARALDLAPDPAAARAELASIGLPMPNTGGRSLVDR